MIPSASSHWDGLPPPGAASSPKPWECDAAASVATLVWPARLMGTRALTPTRPAKKTHRAQKKHPNYPKKHQKTYKTKRPKIPKKIQKTFERPKIWFEIQNFLAHAYWVRFRPPSHSRVRFMQ